MTLLGVANHVNYIGLKLLKIVMPAYCSYKNNDDLSYKMDTAFRKLGKKGKIVTISSDFSSHDAHQHAILI